MFLLLTKRWTHESFPLTQYVVTRDSEGELLEDSN